MGTNSQERTVAKYNERKGSNDLYCTEMLHDSTGTSSKRSAHIERTNTSDKQYRSQGTRLSIRSGTTLPIGFHFSSPGSGEWTYYLHNFEQYKQLEDTKKSLNEYIGNFKRKLDTGKDMDRNSNGNKRSSDIQDENDGGSNNSYSFGTKRIKRLKNKSSGLFQNEEKNI